MEKQDKRTAKRRLGDIGEGIACDYLINKGFKILDRNYLRKWGEIDIVAQKGSTVHFVEVKSVTHGTLGRPEENVHGQKLRRLARAMQTYMTEKRVVGEFQLDVITVRIDKRTNKAAIEVLENVIV